MHDIRYNAVHDEFYVTNPFAKAILTFRGGADGEEAPIRIIQGPSTQLGGNTDRLDVDSVHNEIFIPNRTSILVFPRTAEGDVAPIRVIQGPDTQIRGTAAIAVDPVNNVIVAAFGGDYWSTRDSEPGGLLIYGRTDNGNVKPRGVIYGPKTGILTINQVVIYPDKGWIVATQPGDMSLAEPENVFVGVWSIHDNGDVPPRWKLGGDNARMKKPRGIALNPKNKELIVADMRLNSVLTYYFPEMF